MPTTRNLVYFGYYYHTYIVFGLVFLVNFITRIVFLVVFLVNIITRILATIIIIVFVFGVFWLILCW